MAELKNETDLRIELEALTKEASTLNETRIRIEAELDRIKSEKESIEKELMAEFQTTDIDEIKKELQRRNIDNNNKVNSFRDEINNYKEELNNILSLINKVKQ